MSYVVGLALISALFVAAEAVRPWRPQQRQLRRGLLSDLSFLVFNGHFLGVGLYFVATRAILPPLDAALRSVGACPYVYRNAAAGWPLWAQALVLVVAFDFLQWAIHRLLHAVPRLWQLHKVHHSVVDGEMDWLVSFRFHWVEAVVYKSLQYLPLAFFGFGATPVMIQAFVGTAMGHLNHSNLDVGHGRWRYILNSPRMHLWHHDADGPAKNFGIIFSVWDWLFGTAHLPARAPERIGFEDVAELPRGFIGRSLWPVWRRSVP